MDWYIACEADGKMVAARPETHLWYTPGEYQSKKLHIVIATAPEEGYVPMMQDADGDGNYVYTYIDDLGKASSRDFETHAGTITCPRVHTLATGIPWVEENV